MPPTDVLVIGAGMAGLTAARRLTQEGLSVVVVDKGRGVGGRLATRRMGGARLDHGAQFFTARSEWFRARVVEWEERGVVREWCRGFRQPADGHPRYVGSTGMTALAKDLAAGLDVRTGTRVEAIVRTDAGWTLPAAAPPESSEAPGEGPATKKEGPAAKGEGPAAKEEARAVLATAPVPQTMALLEAGGVTLPGAGAEALAAIRYDPTMAALVTLEGPSAVPSPGGVQLDDGLIRWVGDNAAKGVSMAPAVTLHASGADSTARWEDPPEDTLAALLDVGAGWVGPSKVLDAQLMRWRYAQPTVSHPSRFLVALDGARPLVCAGDAFGEARVEGAALSGWAAAGALLERLA